MGPLLIVGGADRKFQLDIYDTFLENCRKNSDSPLIAVIATASSDRVGAFSSIREKLENAGSCRPFLSDISADNPFPDTGALAEADGFWFTGGDQNLTVKALTPGDGSDSPALEIIRKRNGEGVIIAGTSAGAAIMSDPMICGGDNLPSLINLITGVSWEGEVKTGRGLGFLPGYLVDQHFDVRSRLGRLVTAQVKNSMPIGLGIGENTALFIDKGSARVVGSGSVIRTDVNHCAIDEHSISGIALSLYEKGDIFELSTGHVQVSGKEPVGKSTSLSNRFPRSTGALSPYGDLRNLLSRQLMDNDENLLHVDKLRKSRYVATYLFDPAFSSGEDIFPALEIRFHKREGSIAYAGRDGGFTLCGLEMEIIRREMVLR